MINHPAPCPVSGSATSIQAQPGLEAAEGSLALDARAGLRTLPVFAPWMEADTTDGYTPGLDEIVRFVNAGTGEQAGGHGAG